MSIDVTNDGKLIYTNAFDTVQPVYNVPMIMSATPATFLCSRPRGKDAQAISSGNKTAEQVCISNGPGFYFTDGINTDYPGCGGCSCCKSELPLLPAVSVFLVLLLLLLHMVRMLLLCTLVMQLLPAAAHLQQLAFYNIACGFRSHTEH
jgi:hypothetical protein